MKKYLYTIFCFLIINTVCIPILFLTPVFFKMFINTEQKMILVSINDIINVAIYVIILMIPITIISKIIKHISTKDKIYNKICEPFIRCLTIIEWFIVLIINCIFLNNLIEKDTQIIEDKKIIIQEEQQYRNEIFSNKVTFNSNLRTLVNILKQNIENKKELEKYVYFLKQENLDIDKLFSNTNIKFYTKYGDFEKNNIYHSFYFNYNEIDLKEKIIYLTDEYINNNLTQEIYLEQIEKVLNEKTKVLSNSEKKELEILMKENYYVGYDTLTFKYEKEQQENILRFIIYSLCNISTNVDYNKLFKSFYMYLLDKENLLMSANSLVKVFQKYSEEPLTIETLSLLKSDLLYYSKLFNLEPNSSIIEYGKDFLQNYHLNKSDKEKFINDDLYSIILEENNIQKED